MGTDLLYHCRILYKLFYRFHSYWQGGLISQKVSRNLGNQISDVPLRFVPGQDPMTGQIALELSVGMGCVPNGCTPGIAEKDHSPVGSHTCQDVKSYLYGRGDDDASSWINSYRQDGGV